MSCEDSGVASEPLMPKRVKYDKSKHCVKCKAEAGRIVIRHPYCRECFTVSVIRKFRKSLEPHINGKPDQPWRHEQTAPGNLMIAFSGDLCSTVLLDLVNRNYFSEAIGDVKKGKNHPRNQPTWAHAYVCYVEECNAFPSERLPDRTSDVHNILQSYDMLEFIALRLEDAFRPSWWKSIYGDEGLTHMRLNLNFGDLCLSSSEDQSESLDPINALQDYLATMPTQTAVRAAINVLTRMLLLHAAHGRRASHLLLGSSLTSLSISLINSIAQGGGFNVQEELYEEWLPVQAHRSGVKQALTSTQVVKVIHPLHDMTAKECGGWAWWNGLEVIGHGIHRSLRGKQTIQGLTYGFISGLERTYPSTVSSVVRTCEKLTPKGDSSTVCAVCQRRVQDGIQTWKSAISVVSAKQPDVTDVPDCAESYSSHPSSSSLTPFLCYSCYTTYTSRNPRSNQRLSLAERSMHLPVWVSSIIQSENGEILRAKQTNANQIQSMLAPFLLDE